MGWSRLSDLNVHEGKLLGCSYNQSCVGVWVVDISVLLIFLHFNIFNLSGPSFSTGSYYVKILTLNFGHWYSV